MSTQNTNPPVGNASGSSSTTPAIPAMPMNGSVAKDQHKRAPSMTVTPAGTTSFNANGSSQHKANVQFGQLNSGANTSPSPAMANPQLAQTPSAGLGPNSNNTNNNNTLGPRVGSPSASPSPIPQPSVMTGGRPPSGMDGSQNSMKFGQFNNDSADVNGMTRSLSNMNMDHNRRASQQSAHGGGPHDAPAGPGRGGFSGRGGRGNYSGNNYNNHNNHMGFNPNNTTFRPNQSPGSYRGNRGGHMNYPGSPSMQNRTPMHHPGGTPTMQPMQMAPGIPYGGAAPYHSYPVNTPHNPSHPITKSAARGAHNAARGKPNRGGSRHASAPAHTYLHTHTQTQNNIHGKSRGGGTGGHGSIRRSKKHRDGNKPAKPSKDTASENYIGPDVWPAAVSATAPAFILPAFPLPFPLVADPSCATTSLDPMQKDMLTSHKAAYGQVPIQADPSISYQAAQQYPQGFYATPYQQGPPPSPRTFYPQPGYGGQGMQPQYSNQGAVPPSMSRNSSQISHIDRPGSRVGETPQTPAATLHHGSARAPSVSGKENFQVPKKTTGIVIKNALGEVVDFSKKKDATTPVVAASTPAVSSPTPPSRTGSAMSAAHSRSESQSVKSDDPESRKKAMQEAVARKIAIDKEAEDEQLRKAKQDADDKAAMEAEAKAAAERAEAEAKQEAERKEKEAREAAEKQKAADEAKNKPAESANNDDDEMERMIAEMEAEAAAQEAEEARREEEYQKKKAAQKEIERQKEAAEAAAYEATMKEAERAAEEAELLKEQKRAEGGSSDEEARRLFAQLKGETYDSNEPSPAATPAENNSGANTPLSESSMGPPKTLGSSSRRPKPEQLTLDTKKSTEPPEPSATLKSLTTARRLQDPSSVDYPSGIVSPNPALNANAPADRKFKYNKEFLLQFQNVFKEKPSLDWDQKIREALGHDDSARPQTARTPSGMGGRVPSNRVPSHGAFQMGQFAPPNRPMGAGTTSAERYAASTNAMRGGAIGGNPFAMGRQPSMGPLGGRNSSNNPLGLPGSPRIGGASRGGSRAESKRNKHSAKQEAEQNKSMPLTAGMNITTLEVSSTGWKPRSVGTAAQQPAAAAVGFDGYMEADVVQRKVKAALNKMTPEKFDRISDQILEIAAQSKQETDGRTLRQVIQLVFEKATDEAHWASMYAKFCFKMLSTMSPEIKDEGIKDKNGTVVTGGNLFRKYLLNRCQEEFEKGWKVDLPTGKDGETQEAVMMSDEYYTAMAAKRRGLGLVKFIGELFKLGMLTERIMHECVKKLLDYEGTPDEAEVESLSSLLRTIGKQLDNPESKASSRMDAYFERINQTMNLPDLPSRLKFMLLDIMDLRKAGWDSKDADKGPKTIQQIHEEAEAARAREEMQRLASQANNRGGRMPMGRGDARSVSGYGGPPPPDNSNRVGVDDLRRLGGVRNRTSTPSGQFGPSGLGARTNSGRRGLGPAIRTDDSANTSRTGTPPATAKKDESSNNAFSALAALEGAEGPTSPNLNPSSPPVQQTQPAIERERSRSPEKKENA